MNDPGEFQATALQHVEADTSRIVAKGTGEDARHIVNTALSHDITVLEDFYLSRQLQGIPVGTHIPDSLFMTLSQVLDYLHRMDEKLEQKHEKQAGMGNEYLE